MTSTKPARPTAFVICERARAQSESLKGALGPEAKKRRENYSNIAAICEHLLVAKPIVEPTAENVADMGATLFPYFPAKQTLNNDYRSLLNVWRIAYADILRLKPRITTASRRIPHVDDYEREIGILRAEIKVLGTELSRARAIVANQVPLPTDSAADERPKESLALKLVFEWLREIKEARSVLSPVEFTPSGLKVSSRARPGMVIMKPELVEIIINS